MAASDVSICNLALQKLGAKRITSLADDSPNARSLNACYEAVRDYELRRHTWNFALKRVALAADATAPAFGPAAQYTLPSDFLRLAPIDKAFAVVTDDWIIEGRKVLTNFSAPLNLRYIYRVTDPNEFDAAFVMTLACSLSWHTCEEITQSNTKKADVRDEYKDVVREAKRTNAIERNAYDEPPPDTWDDARH